MAASATAFFLQIYLLDVAQVKYSRTVNEGVKRMAVLVIMSVLFFSSLQINAVQASMVLFIGKAWGAMTDPVVGFFITKSRWTKIGRLMPWYALHNFIFIVLSLASAFT